MDEDTARCSRRPCSPRTPRPNLFEEGTAVTIQEKLPPLAFYPELPGEVVLGHQVSPETGDLTLAPLRLSRDAHFHTAFCGDTGYGKSVAAVRLAYETTLHWKLKTIVLDFGAGWRQLLNAPGLAGHVEIRQLSPGGVRPLRWNPLQIGRNVLPEVQWRAFSDIFGTIAQLGQQAPDPRAARDPAPGLSVRRRAGGRPGVPRRPGLGQVRPAEAAAGRLPGGHAARQPATAGRGRRWPWSARARWGWRDLYRRIETELANVPPTRHPPLDPGRHHVPARAAGAGRGRRCSTPPAPDAVDINASCRVLTSRRGEGWGVAVLEGGAFLDDFSKAFLLGWAAWHLYTDAVVLRAQRHGARPAHMQIFFEEANKILAGLDNAAEGRGRAAAHRPPTSSPTCGATRASTASGCT